jgi:hypothetical protein
MKTLRVPVIFAIVSLTVLLSGRGLASDSAPADGRLVKFLGGEAGFKLVSTTDKVEAYRVEAPITKPGQTVPGKKIDGYQILAGPIDLDTKPLAALRAAILDPGHYDWDIATACEFQPGVVIRFNGRNADGKAARVDLIFCFICGELETWQDGKRVDLKFFGNHRAPFVAAMRQLFPKDDEIQKLGSAQ